MICCFFLTTIYHTLPSSNFYLKWGLTTTKWAKGKQIRLKADKTSSNIPLKIHCEPELCLSESSIPSGTNRLLHPFIFIWLHQAPSINQGFKDLCFYTYVGVWAVSLWGKLSWEWVVVTVIQAFYRLAVVAVNMRNSLMKTTALDTNNKYISRVFTMLHDAAMLNNCWT